MSGGLNHRRASQTRAGIKEWARKPRKQQSHARKACAPVALKTDARKGWRARVCARGASQLPPIPYPFCVTVLSNMSPKFKPGSKLGNSHRR